MNLFKTLDIDHYTVEWAEREFKLKEEELAIKREQLRIDEEENIRRAETQIKVAELYNNKKAA